MMRKKRIKIPRQHVEDHLKHPLTSILRCGGADDFGECKNAGNHRAAAVADDDETAVLLQALHKRNVSPHRFQQRFESPDDENDNSSHHMTTTSTNSSQPTTTISEWSSSICEHSRNERAMQAARGGAGSTVANTEMRAATLPGGIGLIDCIVFYAREMKRGFCRNDSCCRDHADSPDLGYHNYLPGTQCELPQLSFDGDAFKRSRSLDITYLRRRRQVGSDYSDFDNVPHLFRGGQAGDAHQQMTNGGGKMIDKSIPKEVITPLSYEEQQQQQPGTSTLVPDKGKSGKMNWVKAIATRQILYRRGNNNTPEQGHAWTFSRKKSLNVDPDKENKVQTKSGGVHQIENDHHLEEHPQSKDRLKRNQSPPPIRERKEEKQHNGQLKRNQSPSPIRKRMEANQRHNGHLNRTKYPIRQRTLHLHQRPRTAVISAAVVAEAGRQKASKKSDPLHEQRQVSKDNKGRQLQHDHKKKMYQDKPRIGRHAKRRY